VKYLFDTFLVLKQVLQVQEVLVLQVLKALLDFEDLKEVYPQVELQVLKDVLELSFKVVEEL
jgi:hypothetical protein